MAKFNIEVELDWADEEGVNIDELLREEVVAGLQSKLIQNVEQKLNRKLTTMVDDLYSETYAKLKLKSDEILERLSFETLQDLKIPVKESYYSSEVEYKDLTTILGERYEEHATKKVMNSSGKKVSYDAEYSLIDYQIKKYIEDELSQKVVEIVQTARQRAQDTVINTLEESLQQQLSADIVSRLNMPQLVADIQNTITMGD